MTQTPVETAIKALVGTAEPLLGHAAEAKRLLDRHDNVILYGPPGTGKSRAAQQVADWWEATHGEGSVFQTTFHPSYSYEDFIEGFRPDEKDASKFVLTPGVLLKAAKAAVTGPTLLVIDEINRADVAKVFGELITYIESDKRGRKFKTAQDSKTDREIPSDLFVLGTMNTADKSISLLDVALRRRFKFIECPPDPSAFASAPEWASSVDGIDLGQLLDGINNRLLSVGVTRDRLVGQALLAVGSGVATGSAAGPPQPDPNELFDRLRYDVYPLVEEYLFGDADKMRDVLPGLVGDHGGLDNGGLTAVNLQSWIPSSAAGAGPIQDADASGGTTTNAPPDEPAAVDQ